MCGFLLVVDLMDALGLIVVVELLVEGWLYEDLWRKLLTQSIIEELALYERRGRRLRSSRRVLPEDISTRMRVPQHRDPSSERHASSASRLSSNSTKAKPGGLRATHTLRSGPYLPKALSISCLDADEPRLPTYTLQARSHSR